MTRGILGAIIAGGASSRFGSPKALAEVGGVRVVDRVVAALRDVPAVHDVVAIANDEAIGAALGVPYRSDTLQHAGALAGVHAALLWAREIDLTGVLAVACDMPFLSVDLLREIADRATTPSGDTDAVLPQSESRRGAEPLCAWYGLRCIDAIETAIARGDARMIGFHDDIGVTRIPLDVVRRFGDPAVMFRNMNTPADRDAAERLAAEGVMRTDGSPS